MNDILLYVCIKIRYCINLINIVNVKLQTKPTLIPPEPQTKQSITSLREQKGL